MYAVKEKKGMPFTRPAAKVINVTALGLGAKTLYSSSDLVKLHASLLLTIHSLRF